MNTKKILFIGGLGLQSTKIGGQIIKNRILVNFIEKNVVNSRFEVLDSLGAKKKILTFFGKLIRRTILKKYTNIVISLPTPNALKLLKLMFVIKKIRDFHLTYLVIGGSLPERLKANPKLLKYLSICDQICPETQNMVNFLNSKGLNNVFQIPNFKNYSYIPKLNDRSNDVILKTVFFSRVCKEKGVELAIGAVKQLSKKYAVKLDIYGPIDDSYKRKLELLIKDTPNIRYNGVLKPDTNETYEILSQYDLMLFPTLLENEGFAGAIIDSFIAGVPVLASKWPNGLEIITENETGWFFEQNNIDELVSKLEFLIKNKNKLYSVRGNCIEEAKKYHVDNVLPKLLKEMNIEV